MILERNYTKNIITMSHIVEHSQLTRETWFSLLSNKQSFGIEQSYRTFVYGSRSGIWYSEYKHTQRVGDNATITLRATSPKLCAYFDYMLLAESDSNTFLTVYEMARPYLAIGQLYEFLSKHSAKIRVLGE
jgi:hypothetical protein